MASVRDKGKASGALQMKGTEKVLKALETESDKYAQAFAGAIYEMGAMVVAKAVRRAPVGKYTGKNPRSGRRKGLAGGFLRQSAYQTYPKSFQLTGAVGKDFSTRIGFNAVYAATVEFTAIDHARRQYFTTPFNEIAQGFAKRVTQRTKSNYKHGRGLKQAAIPSKIKDKYIRGGTQRAKQ